MSIFAATFSAVGVRACRPLELARGDPHRIDELEEEIDAGGLGHGDGQLADLHARITRALGD